jgi:hypothetical protein
MNRKPRGGTTTEGTACICVLTSDMRTKACFASRVSSQPTSTRKGESDVAAVPHGWSSGCLSCCFLARPVFPMLTWFSVRCRLDSLVGLFAVGKGPSASADPFGLRRSAYALVQTLVENNVPLPLPTALRLTAEAQPVPVDDTVLAEVEQFVTRRLEQLLVSPSVCTTTEGGRSADRIDSYFDTACTSQWSYLCGEIHEHLIVSVERNSV